MSSKNRDKTVTIKDVAKAANVSITTVSRVLNNSFDLVSASTREKVQDAIKGLGFVPNAMARGLHYGKTKTVGLIIQDIANPYYPSIVRNVEDTAQRLGYSIFLANAKRSSARTIQYLEIMQEKRVDGLILVGGAISKDVDRHNFFEHTSMKTVVIGKPYSENLVSVQIDNVAAARTACEHLISLGHRRISMLTGVEISTTARDREAGYMEAMRANKIIPDREWIVRGSFEYDDGFKLVETLFKDGNRQRITAVFAHNDLMAIGAMNALRKKGYRIPEDISVMGFDNIHAASYVTPSLTTIAVPVNLMGQVAMENLGVLLEGGRVQQDIFLPVEIIGRESVGEANGV